jgi:transcriptional regulator with XRE-family HTH domain
MFYQFNKFEHGGFMMDTKACFASRLKELRGDIKQEDFGATIGVSRGAISYYEKETRTADIEILGKICTYYGVSADWLLGLSDVRNPDIEMQAICEYTGLSEQSVKKLLWRGTVEYRRASIDGVEHEFPVPASLRMGGEYPLNWLIEHKDYTKLINSILMIYDWDTVHIKGKPAISSVMEPSEAYQYFVQLSVDLYRKILKDLIPEPDDPKESPEPESFPNITIKELMALSNKEKKVQ